MDAKSILHHFDAMVETMMPDICRGMSRNQGLLGGAKWIPSIHCTTTFVFTHFRSRPKRSQTSGLPLKWSKPQKLKVQEVRSIQPVTQKFASSKLDPSFTVEPRGPGDSDSKARSRGPRPTSDCCCSSGAPLTARGKTTRSFKELDPNQNDCWLPTKKKASGLVARRGEAGTQNRKGPEEVRCHLRDSPRAAQGKRPDDP